MNFFEELRRRNVFRVGIAYAITTWLIAQIAGLSADSFGAPDWVMKMIITVLILGFPVAMVMAWAYEMTPKGLRRDSGDEAAQSANTSKLDRTIIIALVAALAYFSYDKFVISPQRQAAMLDTVAQQIRETPAAAETATDPTVVATHTLAVLPFVNMSNDASNEYFADGLSEELLNMLVKVPQLRVAARTSSFSFKGKDATVADIAEELHVSIVLEGSVRKSGNKVRITAQLIKADDGFHLWSETFDRTMDDIFVMQDEIATAVTNALKVTLLGKPKAEIKISPQAYVLFLKGRELQNQRGAENVSKALEPFLQAVELEPDFAEAWVSLAYEYEELVNIGMMDRREGVLLARNAIAQAKRISPDDAMAWGVEAFVKKNIEWEWEVAQKSLDKAHKLEPNNQAVMIWRASLTGTLGKLEKATKLYEEVYTNDPLNLSVYSALGLNYAKTNRYNDAMEIFKRQAMLRPDYHWAHFNLAKVLLYQGDADQALVEIQKNPDNRFKDLGLTMVYWSLAKEVEAESAMDKLISELGSEKPFFVAAAYSWRGDKDQAFDWLEKAFVQRDSGFAYILGDKVFDSLLDDPRWADLLGRVGLLEYWQAMPAKYGGPQS